METLTLEHLTLEQRKQQFLIALADLQERYGVQLVPSLRAVLEPIGDGLFRHLAEPIVIVQSTEGWQPPKSVEKKES